jgi:hypothetical protein
MAHALNSRGTQEKTITLLYFVSKQLLSRRSWLKIVQTRSQLRSSLRTQNGQWLAEENVSPGRKSPTQSSSLTQSWNWALLQNLPIVQLLGNFPVFYGTRRFIIAFTRALHRSLSWARSIQSIPSHPTSLRSILILSTLLFARQIPVYDPNTETRIPR